MMRMGRAFLFGVHAAIHRFGMWLLVPKLQKVRECGERWGRSALPSLSPRAEGLRPGGGRRPKKGIPPAHRAPHQVNGHDVPQGHGSPDGLGRVLGQVDEPIAEDHVLQGVLLRLGHHDARLVGADGVVDLRRQPPPQERVQAAVGVRREAGPGGAGAGHVRGAADARAPPRLRAAGGGTRARHKAARPAAAASRARRAQRPRLRGLSPGSILPGPASRPPSPQPQTTVDRARRWSFR